MVTTELSPNHQRLRVVIYTRLSTHRGADDPSTSPQRQRESCQAYADAQGWNVIEVVEDLDVSGSARGLRLDRPGLHRIRDLWNKVDVVIFMRLDRLARSVIDFHAFAEEAAEQDVALVSVRDALDLTTPNGRFIASILASFAQLEAETIVERTREGRRRAAAEGRWTGGPVPFGFRVIDNPNGAGVTLAVKAEEATVLHGMVDKLAAGGNLTTVASWLNRETEHLPRRGEPWTRASVKSVLTTQSAAGKIFTAQERRTIKLATTPKPDAPRYGRKPVRLLSTLLRCGSCGGKLAVHRKKPRDVYKCQERGRGRLCEHPTAITADAADEVIEREWLAGWGTIPETRATRPTDEVDEQIATLEERMEELQVRLATATRETRRDLLDELEQLEDTRDALSARPGSRLRTVKPTGRSLGEAWQAGGIDERRDLLASTVGTLTVKSVGRGIKLPPLERLEGRLYPGEQG